tara:strand:+ start:710 stop:1246 length:537 start_codon:yes stop_codon:yes gene_type:complete
VVNINVNKSEINWIGRKVTGEHSGYLKLSNGWISLKNESVANGKLNFDMKTITTTDIESIEWSQKLDEHLMNEDFFFVDSFPTANLKVKSSKTQDLYLVNPIHIITADLTIRGITNEISFPVSISSSNNTYIANGSIDIDRTLFNIKYKSKTIFPDLGDKFIYDTFTINFSIKTIPNI